MSDKIPTFEEFFKEEMKIIREVAPAISHDFKLKAIKWNKLHVKAALEAAADKATWDSSSHEISFGHSLGYDFMDTDYAGDPSTGYKVFVDKDSILNAYPENLIK